MKLHYLAALVLGVSLTAGAQGYKDGIEYYKAGQFDNAITVLDRNLNAADTDKALANYYLGQAYLAKGEKGKAKTYFDAGIAADANNPYNYVGLGAIDLLNHAASQADANFKKAQGLAKKNSEVLVDIARAYYNADATAYTKEIDKYIQKARKDSKNQEPAVYIFEGDRLTKDRDYNGAATQYEQAIYFDSDNPEGYVKYANTYFNVVPQYAIQRLEELLAKKPNSALAQRELAEKYYEADQWSKAAVQYGKYIDNPNHFPQDKARYAILLFAGENNQKSLEVAEEVLKTDPNNVTLSRLVVRNLNALKREPEALQSITAYFNNPAFQGKYNASDYRLYSQLLQANGQDSLAIEPIQKGLAAFPGNGQLLRELSDLYNAQKLYMESADAFQQYIAATEKPSNSDFYVGALRNLIASSVAGDSVSLREKYGDQGIELINRAIDPSDPKPAYLWRKVLLQVTRNKVVQDDAAATINQLIKILDSNSEYANPANKNNYLDEYQKSYQYLIPYYERTGNQEAADNARAMLDKYKALAGTTN